MSCSPTCTTPPDSRQPRRAYPSSARAMVVLPEPDSPINASTSPFSSEKLTPLTISTSPRSPQATTRRSSTRINSLISMTSRTATTSGRQSVDKQIHTNGQGADGQGRNHDGRRALVEAADVFPDQGAEVGIRWLHPQPQEAHAAEQQYDKTEAQPQVGQHRVEHVRQDFHASDVQPALATGTGHLHVLQRFDVHRHAAGDAKSPGAETQHGG